MFEKTGFDVLGFRRSQVARENLPGIAGLLCLPLKALSVPMLAHSLGTQMAFMIRKRV